MKTKVFAVFDSKVGQYNTPFCMRSTAEGLRGWSDAVNDDKLEFKKHPEDYTLFELGEYDGETARFALYETPRSLGVAIEFVNVNNGGR